MYCRHVPSEGRYSFALVRASKSQFLQTYDWALMIYEPEDDTIVTCYGLRSCRPQSHH